MIKQAVWQKFFIIFVIIWGCFAAAPNFLSKDITEAVPYVFPKETVSLGLDLQGGSHLLLEVDVESYLKDKYDAYAGDMNRALRKAKLDAKRPKAGKQDIVVHFNTAPDQATVRKTIEEVTTEFDLNWETDQKLILTFSDQAQKEYQRLALEQSIEIIRRRIDETGTREPIIQRQGADRIIVQLPGVKDPDRIKALLGKTAKLTFHLVEDSLFEKPRTVKPGFIAVENASGQGPSYYLLKKRIATSGEYLTNAQATFQDNQPVVSFRFDNRGARQFGRVTAENVDKQLAIVLDNKVISAPNINGPILTGSGIIIGNFTTESAKDLAILLRSGALPAPLVVLEERTVGPSLGQDSIDSGKMASVIGLIFVLVFMILVYRFFGIVANIALVVNIILILAALSFLQATLTLPGIAGIVLTIGMAVDANVLIFERIREEVRAGRKLAVAINDGYQRALKTIIDANLTTFFAAFLLFSFGSGPIKGFAVTLSIGLLTSMFSALLVTKSLIILWYNTLRPKKLPVA